MKHIDKIDKNNIRELLSNYITTCPSPLNNTLVIETDLLELPMYFFDFVTLYAIKKDRVICYLQGNTVIIYTKKIVLDNVNIDSI